MNIQKYILIVTVPDPAAKYPDKNEKWFEDAHLEDMPIDALYMVFNDGNFRGIQVS